MPVVAMAQITLLDLNDAVTAGTPPKNPVHGTLWIDTSVTPNVLKMWDESKSDWIKQSLSLEDLDNGAWQDIKDMEKNIFEVADDSKLTQGERIPIREKVMDVTGATTLGTTLPIISAIDTSKLGEVYTLRQEAQKAGVATNHASYTAYEGKYNALKAYLETISPRPWDTANTTTATIVIATWNTNWRGYLEAVANLRVAISEQQKKNAADAEAVANRLSTRGLALKDGFSSYTVAAAGQIYFHGYDAKGNPADVDPYLVVNGVNKAIKKGVLNPGGTYDRGYLMYDDAQSSWYLIRTVNGAWTRYNVGKFGHNAPFTFDDTKQFIVGYLSE